METNLINFALAFAEGFALIISPCILPILPIMLIGGIEGGKYRPFGIMIGFVLTFAVFTLFARLIIQTTGINLNIIRNIAYIAIIFFGIILISNKLSELFNQLTAKITTIGTKITTNSPQPDFYSGIILGALISLIWVPCGGPILAAAIIQSAVQNTVWQSFLIFLFFALGSVIPMTLITLFSKKLIKTMQFFKKRAELLRKLFGLIIIVAAIYTIFWDETGTNTPMLEAPNVVATTQSTELIDRLSSPYAAPDLKNITMWLNSSPLTLKQLHGKVVLIDFWTYSCINCLRTLPYLKDWYHKYHNDGLIIIGVHTPEFEFEKNPANVEAAVKKLEIYYPVALDNTYATWLNYNNQYWPAHYLIDQNGNVVYIHFGEGGYADTEHNIQVLLGKSNQPTSNTEALTTDTTFFSQITPETYLGSARGANYAGHPALVNGEFNFYLPQQLERDQWALSGKWLVQPEWIQAQQIHASVKIHFYAKKVFVVLGNDHQETLQLKIRLNNRGVEHNAGKDVTNSTLEVTRSGLYEILSLPTKQMGDLELIAQQPKIKIYTFTFGD